MAVFWVVAPCSLVEIYQRFRGPCCLHHQVVHLTYVSMFVFKVVTPRGPAGRDQRFVWSSKTLVSVYRSTLHYNPVDQHSTCVSRKVHCSTVPCTELFFAVIQKLFAVEALIFGNVETGSSTVTSYQHHCVYVTLLLSKSSLCRLVPVLKNGNPLEGTQVPVSRKDARVYDGGA
jgi:hypothetical protein